VLCLSLSIRAAVRALCAFLSCSRVHFIFAYCTVFNERINNDDDDELPITSSVYHGAYSYQVTSISDQQFLRFLRTDAQTPSKTKLARSIAGARAGKYYLISQTLLSGATHAKSVLISTLTQL